MSYAKPPGDLLFALTVGMGIGVVVMAVAAIYAMTRFM